MRILNRPAPDDFEIIENENGDLLENYEAISAEIVRYYKKLYEDYEKNVLREEEDDEFFNNIGVISENDASEVSKPIDKLELGKTLATCKDSAPGPDGIPYAYLRHLWPVIGDIVVNAWNYSLATKALPPSHKLSILKLIPKAGKDLKKLTNWCPITLSNCDHKLITKCYANRMSAKMATVISETQTAYLKGRMINDNIRAMIMALNAANEDENVDGLLVSLDAKKAFDSVEHSYIIKCLEKVGLSSFVGIFKILYRDLSSDIIINGKIVKGFRILRGVKQGDALSCVLFIICMEPLLRNIEANDAIEKIYVDSVSDYLPKVMSYADDVNGTIKNNAESIKNLFY